ncbi:8678_t:CDS:2, partial [Entrophospora sp. SA101]
HLDKQVAVKVNDKNLCQFIFKYHQRHQKIVMKTTSKDKRPNKFEFRPCSGWSDEDGEIQYGITLAERMLCHARVIPY